MIRKMRRLNHVSAALFSLSSFSLLLIPLFLTDAGRPTFLYIVAAFFWMGLIAGTILQLVLSIQCRKLKLQNKGRMQRVPFLLSFVFFVTLIVLICRKSNNMIAVDGSLFATVASLQSAVIIRREGYLK